MAGVDRWADTPTAAVEGRAGCGGNRRKPHLGRIGKRIPANFPGGGDPEPVLKGEWKVGSLEKCREEAAAGRGHRMSKNLEAPCG